MNVNARVCGVAAAMMLGLLPATAGAQLIYDRGPDLYAAGDDGSNPHLLVAASWLGMDGLGAPAVSGSGNVLLFDGGTNKNQYIGGHANWYGDFATGAYALSGGQVARLSPAPAPDGATTNGDYFPEPTTAGNFAFGYSRCDEVATGSGGYDNVCTSHLGAGAVSGGTAGAAQFATPCDSSSSDHPHYPTQDPATTTLRLAYAGCSYNTDPNNFFSDDQAAIYLSGPGQQGLTAVGLGEDTSKVSNVSGGFQDPAFSPDGNHIVAYDTGGEHETFDASYTATVTQVAPRLVVFDDLTQPTAGRTLINAPSDGNGGYVPLLSPRYVGADKIVFAAAGSIWSVPSSCNNCSFPADATKVLTGGTTASTIATSVAWTSGSVTPGSAPPPPPPSGNGGTNGGTTNVTPSPSPVTPSPSPVKPSPSPVKPSPSPVSSALKVTLQTARALVTRGATSLKLICRGGAAGSVCRGRIAVKLQIPRRGHRTTTITLGSAGYSVPSGSTRAVTLRLSRIGLATLSHAKGGQLKSTAQIAPRGGSATAQRLVLWIAPPPRRHRHR